VGEKSENDWLDGRFQACESAIAVRAGGKGEGVVGEGSVLSRLPPLKAELYDAIGISSHGNEPMRQYMLLVFGLGSLAAEDAKLVQWTLLLLGDA
jgi:hypothetical protein